MKAANPADLLVWRPTLTARAFGMAVTLSLVARYR
jgi:hypothetical protein